MLLEKVLAINGGVTNKQEVVAGRSVTTCVDVQHCLYSCMAFSNDYLVLINYQVRWKHFGSDWAERCCRHLGRFSKRRGALALSTTSLSFSDQDEKV